MQDVLVIKEAQSGGWVGGDFGINTIFRIILPTVPLLGIPNHPSTIPIPVGFPVARSSLNWVCGLEPEACRGEQQLHVTAFKSNVRNEVLAVATGRRSCRQETTTTIAKKPLARGQTTKMGSCPRSCYTSMAPMFGSKARI